MIYKKKVKAMILALFFVLAIPLSGYSLYREDVDYEQVKEQVEKKRSEIRHKLRQRPAEKNKQVKPVPATARPLPARQNASRRPLNKVFVFMFLIIVVGLVIYFRRRQRVKAPSRS